MKRLSPSYKNSAPWSIISDLFLYWLGRQDWPWTSSDSLDLTDLCYSTLGEYARQLGVAFVPSGVIILPDGNALMGSHMWFRIINEALAVEHGVFVRNNGFPFVIALASLPGLMFSIGLD